MINRVPFAREGNVISNPKSGTAYAALRSLWWIMPPPLGSTDSVTSRLLSLSILLF
jgi:hypothetical protein